MKKLTAKEILSLIEELGISVEDFAYGDFGAPDDFKLSDKVQKLKTEKEAAYESFMESQKNLTWQERQESSDVKEKRELWTNLPNYYTEANNEWYNAIGLGGWKEVAQYGGIGQGDTWYSIKHFKDHDVYIRTDGFYSSYNGTDFYDGYGKEVKPKEKVVTVFE